MMSDQLSLGDLYYGSGPTAPESVGKKRSVYQKPPGSSRRPLPLDSRQWQTPKRRRDSVTGMVQALKIDLRPLAPGRAFSLGIAQSFRTKEERSERSDKKTFSE